MKFKSRIDITFKLIFAAISFLFAILIGESFLFKDFSVDYILVFDIIIATFWLIIIWMFLDTRYKVTEEKLTYRSGPLRGKAPIDKINKIIVGKTAWAGSKKIALARNGLLIKHSKGKELYISPNTNEVFVDYIKKLNPSIKLKKYERYIVK